MPGQFSSDTGTSFGAQLNSGLSFAWREYIGKTPGCTQQYAWGDDASQATMTIDVLWDDYVNLGVVPGILGTSQVISIGGTKRIARSLPWRHPAFPQLYAEKIASVSGVKPRGKATFGRPIQDYWLARMTVLFTNRPYRVVDDATLGSVYSSKEYHRFLERQAAGTSEILNRERGAHGLKWAQGALATQDVAFGIGQVVTKEQFVFVWHNVPAAALYGIDLTGSPTNILNGVGRVNSATFLNRPAGTLLLNSYQARPRQTPYPPTLIGLGPFEPPLAYDVIFNVLFFDPPAVDTAVARGHQLLPIPGDATGRWGLVTHDGTTGGQKLYGTYDYETLFVPT